MDRSATTALRDRHRQPPPDQQKHQRIQDAAAWRPKHRYQCDYATKYVTIKARYALPVDRSEEAALGETLATCSGGTS